MNMREKMVLWILRVYKIPFTLKLGSDYKEFQNNAKLFNEQLREKIAEGFYRDQFRPVVSDNEFRKRSEIIRDIVDEYKNKY